MDMIATVQRHWWSGLTAILAIYYLAVGVGIGGTTGIAAIVGAILIGSGLWVRSRSRILAAALLILGALPLAALTWWSAIAPVLAVLALICGGVAITTARRTRTIP
jgi:hypothetical protein